MSDSTEGLVSDRYPPFSGDTRCPKCGGDMSTEHFTAGTVYVGRIGNAHHWRMGYGPEWLLRECNSCGHGWAEAPVAVHPMDVEGEAASSLWHHVMHSWPTKHEPDKVLRLDEDDAQARRSVNGEH